MVNYAIVAKHIDHGLKIAGKHVGQPFSVYRIESTSSGHFPEGWSLIAQKEPFLRRRIKDTNLENALVGSGSLWYAIVGNVALYLLGDVFLQTDPAYASGISYGAGATILYDTPQFDAFAFAWHPPIGQRTGARLDRRAMIYRPSLIPKISASDGSGYWESTKDNDTPLILTSGIYNWGQPSDSGSYVPVGVGSTHRFRGDTMFPPKEPGMTDAIHYYLYLPPLPGYQPVEGDAIITEDGVRFLVIHPYDQQAGVVGSQLIVKRLISEKN